MGNEETVQDNAELAAFEKLVEQSIQGDKEALLELCESIAKSVLFRTTLKLNNKMDAEDATQEVLIRVCTKIGNLENPKAFNKWLSIIITNETNRHFEKGNKHKNVLDLDDYLDVVETDEKEFLPQERVLEEAERSAVMDIIKTLPQRQHDAVMLHYYDGLNVYETAEVMGISQPGVSKYLSIARNKIKVELEKRAKTDDVLGDVAAVPVGLLLSDLFVQESALFAVAEVSSVSKIVASATSVLSTSAAQAAAPSAVASGAIWTTVTVAATACVTTVALASGVMTVDAPALVEVAPIVQESAFVEVHNVTGAIEFESTDPGFAHVNPFRAIARTDSSSGELSALGWSITSHDGNTVLHAGFGSVVEQELVSMREQGLDGEYRVVFEMEDAAGTPYTLSKAFQIRSIDEYEE